MANTGNDPISTEWKPRGYLKLAGLMSQAKDVAIFRRFDDLSMLCLLELQAEIVKLRKDLLRTCHLDDQHGQMNEKAYSGSFKLSREGDSEQYQLVVSLKKKLQEYYALAVQVSQVNILSNPRADQLRGLQEELNDKANNFLRFEEFDTWASNDESSYMCLNPGMDETDLITRWLENFVVGPFNRYLGSRVGAGKVIDEETGSRSYNAQRINTASNVITTVLSTTLPVVAIFALNAVETLQHRLGLTVLFTALFALTLAVCTSAKRLEIFAATATFAAVEVVFIGSALNSSGVPESQSDT